MVLAGSFLFSGKRWLKELGWFIYAFAEITDRKSTESKVHRAEPRFQMVIYTTSTQKIKCGNKVFRFFLNEKDMGNKYKIHRIKSIANHSDRFWSFI